MSQPPNDISIGSALTRVTHRQTDTQTTLRATSVAISRILCAAYRRCGLKTESITVFLVQPCNILSTAQYSFYDACTLLVFCYVYALTEKMSG